MITSSKIAWAITLLAGAGIYILSRKRSNPPSLIEDPENSYNMSTNPALPRGYRNNNPLNIRYSSANRWKGKVLPNKDANNTFEQFCSMEYGYRAALYLIRRYIKDYKCNTISKIIGKWAPENENDTQKYIDDVCRITGYKAHTIVSANDATQLCNIAYAMSIIENGQTAATREAGLPNINMIYKGYQLL